MGASRACSGSTRRIARCRLVAEFAALLAHGLADDLGQSQRARARVIAVGKYQIEVGPALAALAQRERLQGTLRELAAHGFLGEPGKTESHGGRMDGRGLL